MKKFKIGIWSPRKVSENNSKKEFLAAGSGLIFADLFKISISGLMVHRNRSFLTILGIVIGIASIMVVMSVGESAKKLVMGEVESFGPTNIFVLPGRQPKGLMDFGGTLFTDSLTSKDLEDLKRTANVPAAVRVVPFVFGEITAVANSESYNTTLLGGTPDLFDVFKLKAAAGDIFTDLDVAQKSAVVLIGQDIAEELFGASDPVGEKIKIKDKNFKIIGLLESKSKNSFVDFDKAIVSPYSTAQQYVLGFRYFQRITVEAATIEDVPETVIDIERLLSDNHNIDNPDDADFFVRTQEDLAGMLGNITGILTSLLASVAAISLLVGGIGITNIMFVSVTERTREIGLRKALGATGRDIFSQFLIEAVFLTLAGGLIGITGGIIFTYLASVIITAASGIDFPFVFSMTGAVLGVITAFLIGLFFGIFPAVQAARKNPIESLRYE
ncbi:MAG: ABC transporter permease [bacterium]|nr:ABC transporter permease [bacterium]